MQKSGKLATRQKRNMSTTDELKNMLMTFRVSELQMLLGFAGQNKSGRKTELQARAIELLRNKSAHVSQIQTKIRELYKTIQSVSPGYMQASQQQQVQAQVQANHQVDMIAQGMSHTMLSQPRSGMVMPQTGPPMGSYINQACTQSNMYGNLFSSYRQKPVPIQPDVRLKRLPFYDILGELLKPSSLVPQGSQRTQETNFCFQFTVDQVSSVTLNREVGPCTRNDYLAQVQLRFCVAEPTNEQEDCFPPGAVLKVNNKICQLPNPIPTNKPGVEPKRPPRPVNISPQCKLSPFVMNNINVGWTNDYRGYCVAIYLVHKLTAGDLLARLKTKGPRDPAHTTGLIKEKLAEDPDTEIATTSLRVSLLCPLGKNRMSVPCRSTTCTHLQCFDASLFLQMNEKKPTWTCPVCDKAALFDNLVIDGYFQDVLNSSVLSPDCHEIQLHKDGSWSCDLPKKESLPSASPPRGTPNNKSVLIEEILDEDDPPEKMPKITKDAETPEAKDMLTIDLTTSDDDDDDDDEDDEDQPRKTEAPPVQNNSIIQFKPDHTLSDTSSTGDRMSPNIINLDSPSPPPSPTPAPTVPTTKPPSIPSSMSPVLPSPVATPPGSLGMQAQMPHILSPSPNPPQPAQQYPVILSPSHPSRPLLMSIRMPPNTDARYNPY